MTMDEIYAHFQLPFDLRNSLFKSNFTKDAITRMKKQKSDLIAFTKKLIKFMIRGRKLLVEKVFQHDYDARVHVPVNFKRIIKNIRHQMHIQANSLVDITPYEVYMLV